jgi:L-fuconolactonase
MRIDAHQHYWSYSDEEYDWIPEDVIRRDFAPADLKPLIDRAGIDGVIAVQARTCEAENKFLLAHAAENDWIKAVVGWTDLRRADVERSLAELASNAKMRGVREVLQGMDDDAFCLRDDFNRGVALLREFDLVYDVLIFHRHLPNAVRFVDQHPEQVFVLDHIAKPEIRTEVPDAAWVTGMRDLAKREHVFCKLSGMVTEVRDRDGWDADLLKPYFEVVLEAFGAERVMFGSDWPVCLLQADYAEWVTVVDGVTAQLSEDERAAIWGGNAARAYGL